MHVAQEKLEDTLFEVVGPDFSGDLLDIGTGTGRILKIFADKVSRGVGIDMSSGMLAVARSNLESGHLKHIHVRKGDMYQLPIEDGSFDLAVLHMVLHYSDNPAEAIQEASRVLRANGRLIVVDFAAHSEEYLRTDYQHHRLGFADSEIHKYFESAGMTVQTETTQLVGEPLTVKFWLAEKSNNLVSLRDQKRLSTA